MFTAIGNGCALAVSDGSYDPVTKVGTSDFIIASSKANDEDLFEGANFVTGTAEEQNAYRSELAGVLGVIFSCYI